MRQKPTEGPDFSTLFDHEYVNADPRTAEPPIARRTSKADAEERFLHLVATINRDARFGHPVPPALRQVTQAEAKALLLKWEGSPQHRDIIPCAREAARWRVYLRRLDIEAREQEAADAANRLAKLKREANPDPASVEARPRLGR